MTDDLLPEGAPLPEPAKPEPLTAAELHEYAEMMVDDGWATDFVGRTHATADHLAEYLAVERTRVAELVAAEVRAGEVSARLLSAILEEDPGDIGSLAPDRIMEGIQRDAFEKGQAEERARWLASLEHSADAHGQRAWWHHDHVTVMAGSKATGAIHETWEPLLRLVPTD